MNVGPVSVISARYILQCNINGIPLSFYCKINRNIARHAIEHDTNATFFNILISTITATSMGEIFKMAAVTALPSASMSEFVTVQSVGL
jgi:hypothetical protein